MKVMTKYLAFFLALLIAFVFMTGCAVTGDGEVSDSDSVADTIGDTTPVITDVSVKIFDPNDKSKTYNIIRPEKCDDETITAASGLWKTLTDKVGALSINILEDWTKEPTPLKSTNREILVGLTNRVESIEATNDLPSYLDYTITVTENKICIVANTGKRLTEAVNYFKTMLKYEEDGSVTFEGKSYILNKYQYPLADFLVGGAKLSDYRIVVSSSAVDQEKNLADRLSVVLAEKTGKMPAVVTDADGESSETEIVIGKTNRSSSYETLESNEYTFTLKGSRIFILAGSNGGYSASFNTFTELLDSKNKDKFAADFTDKHTGESLDGKKVMFLGNSFVFYGGCVVTGSQQSTDAGWFYQICKENGEKCTVYDYTYGGKDLAYIYANYLKGHTYTGFDYVIFSDSGSNHSDTWLVMQNIMKCFTGTPQMVYMNHSFTVYKNHSNLLSLVSVMQKNGVLISNWGQLVYDMDKKQITAPGMSMKYNKNSFIKNNGDTYHPNPLSGYITAQMTYCLITGKSAVGQMPNLYTIGNKMKYSSGAVGYDAFISKHYTSANASNFKNVMSSATEMKGIQQLIDKYIEMYN